MGLPELADISYIEHTLTETGGCRAMLLASHECERVLFHDFDIWFPTIMFRPQSTNSHLVRNVSVSLIALSCKNVEM